MKRRRRGERRPERAPAGWPAEAALGQREASTPLHEERLDAVVAVLRAHGAGTVLDLGCGAGALLTRLAADPRFTRIVGVDQSHEALGVAARALAAQPAAGAHRVELRHGSFLAPDAELAGFDAAVLVEAVEHVPPAHLSRLETALFSTLRPRIVVLTTPNRDYNPRLGFAEGELRHPDHAFEWSRGRFRAWAEGVAGRTGRGVELHDVGRADPFLGAPTQMAVFTRPG